MKKLSKALLSSVLSLCLTACGLASPSDTSDYSDGFPEVSNESENTAVSDDSFPNVDDTEAPGTLTDVDELPIADASEVGKKVTVNLALNGKTEEISFVFRRNAETGKERLVTIENSNDSKNVMLLSVYETSLGSGEALCEALETGTCDAVLAARVYIDWIEGKYTTNSFHGLMNDTGADGFVQKSVRSERAVLFRTYLPFRKHGGRRVAFPGIKRGTFRLSVCSRRVRQAAAKHRDGLAAHLRALRRKIRPACAHLGGLI